MRFSEILSKMVDGQTLSVEEKQTIVQEARRMEENSALLSSIVKPGTKILVLDGVDVTDANVINANIIDAKIVSAEAGDVVLDEFGIFIRYGSIYGITFGDSGGGNRIRILSSSGDQLQFQNELGNIEFVVDMTDGSTPFFVVGEDDTLANRFIVEIPSGTQGARLMMFGDTGSGQEGLFEVRTQGSGGGSTFMRMRETSTTPPNPGSLDSYHMYIKSDKLVIQFNDGGTVRYKYLDLTGTGVTWQHTTTIDEHRC